MFGLRRSSAVDGQAEGNSLDDVLKTRIFNLRHEALWRRELRNLKRSPVFRGEGIPLGNGRPVLLIRGLHEEENGEESLRVIREWLGRINYRPIEPDIKYEKLTPEYFHSKIGEAYKEASLTGQQPDVIGYSMGAMMTKNYVRKHPRRFRKVLLFCAPSGEPVFVYPKVKSKIRQLADRIGEGVVVDFIREAVSPLPDTVDLYEFAARYDGVMRSDANPSSSDKIRSFDCSHRGIMDNEKVFEEVAFILAAR